MNRPGRSGRGRRRGFALILTLALLALLVLVTLALATLGRIDSRLAATAGYQTGARQNALLGLQAGLGELQRLAAADGRLTAMAGIAGVPAGAAGGRTRHWCGVWDPGGRLLGWLASGATATPRPALSPGLAGVMLVANGSVGAEATNSEHVMVGRVPIRSPRGSGESWVEQGGFAWWVGDEGGKISAWSPPGETAVAGVAPIPGSVPAVSATLRAALVAHVAKLPALLSFEQIRLLPTPAGAPLTNSTLWDNFHHVSLTPRWVEPAGAGPGLRTGRINLNTTSTSVWRGIAETYNSRPGLPDIAATRLAAFSNAVANGLAGANEGKASNAPYGSVGAFMGGPLLEAALAGSGVTPGDFATGMGGVLAVRSDTFRVRSYGDAVNPATGETESRAYCEAIVQRIADPAGGNPGRRFSIIYFRWLGPDDI